MHDLLEESKAKEAEHEAALAKAVEEAEAKNNKIDELEVLVEEGTARLFLEKEKTDTHEAAHAQAKQVRWGAVVLGGVFLTLPYA